LARVVTGARGARRTALAMAVLLASASLSTTRLASAQTDEDATRVAARQLGTSGVDAYEAGRFDQASEELNKAYSILRVPSLGLWSARALAKRQKLVEAAERYLEAAGLQIPQGDSAIQQQAIAEAKAELAALRPTIPTLRIRLLGATPSEIEVWLDDEPVAPALITSPRLLNPGTHRIVAERGHERVRAWVTLSQGQSQELQLRFGSVAPTATSIVVNEAPTKRTVPAAAPPADVRTSSRVEPRHAQRTGALVAFAAGGAGLLVGGVSGVLALGERKTLDDSGACLGGCPPSYEAEVDRLNTYRTVSSVGFIAGGVLAATGLVLWITAPKNDGGKVRAAVGPSGLMIGGDF
jgi:hypothetical protein